MPEDTGAPGPILHVHDANTCEDAGDELAVEPGGSGDFALIVIGSSFDFIVAE